ncbi:hypothetical protein M8C21_027124 [Ambrosia artemisiifolia]|uniref:Uncharacterized protein n=1 Tax=Ambrosia artemisiifolia TaxID=4212 RepID=A0AAD5BNE1_AMBAR|nr:hypothetical protein M8C21_027124 [Ambrosia artemisiifolia]
MASQQQSLKRCDSTLTQESDILTITPLALPYFDEIDPSTIDVLLITRTYSYKKDVLDNLEGVTWNKAEGTMYLDPRIVLPNKVHDIATRGKYPRHSFKSTEFHKKFMDDVSIIIQVACGFRIVVFTDLMVAERVVRHKHIIDGRIVEAKKTIPRDDQQLTWGMRVFTGHRAPFA